ncbi:MAG: hypothetical protein IJ107_03820 [Lachnospiraceae bacterium]|nr:hypothetical protein [Lachnospiraceae bacterium]
MNDSYEQVNSELPMPAIEEPIDAPAPVSFAGLGPFKTILAIAFALALAFFTVLVEHVRRTKQFGFSTTAEYVTTGLQVLVYVVLFVIGWKLLDWFDRKAILAEGPAAEKAPEATAAANVSATCGAPTDSTSSEETCSEPNDPTPASRGRLLLSWSPRSVALTWLLLLCLFLPYLLVFYPGVAGYDTTNQIKDFVTGTMPIEINWNEGAPMISCFLNDHHPVFDTLIFTFFTEAVGGLLGSPVHGAFAYCALQMAMTALFLSLMLCRMEKFGMPYAYRKAGFLFLGFAPFIGMYTIVMLKDSLHSMLFIVYYLLYAVIILEGASGRRMVGLTILAILLALTKKTGIYFVLICNLALILVPTVRRKWAEWAASWILPALLMFVLLPHVIFPMYNIFAGGKQEALGFTLQMTARTYLDHKDELTPQEVQVIGSVIDLTKVEECYSSYNYDEVKELFNFEATDDQLSAYKRLWLQLFVRYPLSGLNALFGTAGGFFSPTEGIRLYYDFPTTQYVKIENPPALAPFRDAFREVYLWMITLPGVGLLLQCVLYAWWLPLAALLRVLLLPDFKGRRLQSIGCLLPAAVCVLVLWVSPYAMARYALPLFYTLPLIMGIGARRK